MCSFNQESSVCNSKKMKFYCHISLLKKKKANTHIMLSMCLILFWLRRYSLEELVIQPSSEGEVREREIGLLPEKNFKQRTYMA